MSYQGFCYLLNHTEVSFCQANRTTLTEPLVPQESRHLPTPPPPPTQLDPCKILQSQELYFCLLHVSSHPVKCDATLGEHPDSAGASFNTKVCVSLVCA